MSRSKVQERNFLVMLSTCFPAADGQITTSISYSSDDCNSPKYVGMIEKQRTPGGMSETPMLNILLACA